MSYTEDDYLNLTNLTKLRIAQDVLRSVTPHVDEVLVKVALRITARLVIFLESRLNEESGERAEWPQGPCLKPAAIPCSAPKGHDEKCS